MYVSFFLGYIHYKPGGGYSPFWDDSKLIYIPPSMCFSFVPLIGFHAQFLEMFHGWHEAGTLKRSILKNNLMSGEVNAFVVGG